MRNRTKTGKRVEWVSRRGWMRLKIIAVIGTISVGGWLALPHKKHLMDVAHSIVALDTDRGTFDQRRQPREEGYWLSDTRLLILTADEDQTGGVQNGHGHADLLDTSNSTRKRLTGLTNLLNQPEVSLWNPYREGIELSPRRSWLQWVVPNQKERFDWVLAKWDGSQHRRIPYYGRRTTWLDEQLVADIDRDDNNKLGALTVFDAQQPEHISRYAGDSKQAQSILSIYYLEHSKDIQVEDRNGQSFIVTYNAQPSSGKRTQINMFPVALQGKGELRDYQINEQQTAIVYRLVRAESIPFLSLIHRFLPFIPLKSIFTEEPLTEELWVSSINGEGMHEIGDVSIERRDAGHNPETQLTNIQWLPGGNQISLSYKGMLYVVPGEAGK